MAVLGSPFTAGAAASLPDVKIGEKSRLIIRLDGEDTDRVVIRLGGQDADATHAQFFLMGTEALELNGEALKSASDVSILATSGTPAVYWGIA